MGGVRTIIMLLAAALAPICGPQHAPPAGADLCHSSHQVQEAILERLDIGDCVAATPQDIAAIRNLKTSGPLRAGDLDALTGLRSLILRDIDHWPPNLEFPDLPRLEKLEIHLRGPAAFGIYRPEATWRMFGNLLHRLPEIRIRLYLHLPRNTERTDKRIEERRITAAMEHSLRKLLPGQPYPETEGSHAAEGAVNVIMDPHEPPCPSDEQEKSR